MPERVLVFCAHSDDQVFGAGGYISVLAKQKVDIRTIICSFGEQSHPHLVKEEVRKMRVEESKKADRMLGGNGVMFLGLREGSFEKDFGELEGTVLDLLGEFKPDRILTHSQDDPHPDHRATYRILLGLCGKAGLKSSVYTFDVWNLFNLTKRLNPKLVVNIKHTFKKKVDALGAFRSQRPALAVLLWSVYTKALFWGFRAGCRYAEVFYKVR